MKLKDKNFIFFSLLYFIIIQWVRFTTQVKLNNQFQNKDPFAFLGIEDWNPKKLLEELEKDTVVKGEGQNGVSFNNGKLSNKRYPKWKTIEDLPKFLKETKLKEEEALTILTKFLIQDDYILKKHGVIYDESGFDGLSPIEIINSPGTQERWKQRARSAGNLFFKEKFPELDYDAYGAEEQNDEIINNWRIFKVLLISKDGKNTFVKVCLPLSESEPALCSSNDDLCEYRTKIVEQQKLANEEYLGKIKNGGFFQKGNHQINGFKENKIQLRPGENANFVPEREILFKKDNIKNNELFDLISKVKSRQLNSKVEEVSNNSKNSFNFKEKDNKIKETQNKTSDKNRIIAPQQNSVLAGENKSIHSNKANEKINEVDNNSWKNEIEEMKKQLNVLMKSMNDKDKIIKDQQEQWNKLSPNSISQSETRSLSIGDYFGAV